MKMILRPDVSVILALLAFAAAIVARLTASRQSLYRADRIAAIVAISGHPSGA